MIAPVKSRSPASRERRGPLRQQREGEGGAGQVRKSMSRSSGSTVVDEIRQFVSVVHERNRDARESRLADRRELGRDELRRTNQRIGPRAAHEPLAVQPVGRRVVRAGELLLVAHVMIARRRCPPSSRRSARNTPPPRPATAGIRRGRSCSTPTSRPAAAARACMSAICARPASISMKVVNRKSAARAAKSRPGGENPAFSVTGRGLLHRARQAGHAAQIVILAGEVERRRLGIDAASGSRTIPAPGA